MIHESTIGLEMPTELLDNRGDEDGFDEMPAYLTEDLSQSENQDTASFVEPELDFQPDEAELDLPFAAPEEIAQNSGMERVQTSAGSFVELKAIIDNAIEPTTIQVTAGFDFTEEIVIDGGKEITIQPDNPNSEYEFGQTSTSLLARHFTILEESSLTLDKGIVLVGDITGEGRSSAVIGGVQLGRVNTPSRGSSFIMNGATIRNVVARSSTDTGAINVRDGYFLMNNGTLIDNESRIQSGGAIYTSGAGYVRIRNGSFFNNRALGTTGGSGGAIFSLGGATIDVEGGTFQGNHADVYGGAVGYASLLPESRTEISGAIFTNNTAGTYGGAVGVRNFRPTSMALTDSVVFSGNRLTGAGFLTPPLNVEQAYPNLASRSSSVPEVSHPLNNFDVGFLTSTPPVSQLTVMTDPPNFENIAIQGQNIQSGRAFQGVPISLSVTEVQGYTFVGWSGGEFIDASQLSTDLIMGNTNTTVTAHYRQNALLRVFFRNQAGEDIETPLTITGFVGDPFTTEPITKEGWVLLGIPDNANGIFDVENEVIYTYVPDNVVPLDPLDPEVEFFPDGHQQMAKTELVTIDFLSQFAFGKQAYSLFDTTFYAQLQGGTDAAGQPDAQRPNYIQISDRRLPQDQGGWRLTVRQASNFRHTTVDHELTGAQLSLQNGTIIAPGNATPPGMFRSTVNINQAATTLITADAGEGQGTWLYRIGDNTTGAESVHLDLGQKIPREGVYTATF
ncbi:WxL domain-containing protein [Enterococcus sp. DIV0876]|uniref:WxL domain-containing protein n=1 Tax=Enterococcus sp. DIV0876 TaxID=2774633 RepID=UPI003D2FDAD3